MTYDCDCLKYADDVYADMEIVRTKGFDRDLKRIGATDSDYAALSAALAEDPKAGDPIRGLSGVRKIRFALPSRNIGKSGGARAIYIVLEVEDALILLMAYQKNEKDELSAGDRKALKSIVDELKG